MSCGPSAAGWADIAGGTPGTAQLQSPVVADVGAVEGPVDAGAPSGDPTVPAQAGRERQRLASRGRSFEGFMPPPRATMKPAYGARKHADCRVIEPTELRQRRRSVVTSAGEEAAPDPTRHCAGGAPSFGNARASARAMRAARSRYPVLPG